MLLHGEQYWLIGYVLVILAATYRFYKKGMRAPEGDTSLALFGSIGAFYGWLFQVGRFG